MAKDSDNPSINIYKVEAIFLVFQVWSPTWHKKRVIIHTSSTAAFGLEDSILQNLANASQCPILLLAAKCDAVIKAQWIDKKRNGLANVLSRFDDYRLMILVLFQNLLNLMARPLFIYLSHPAQQLSNVLPNTSLLPVYKKAIA